MKSIITIILCMTITYCIAQESSRFSLGVKAGAGWSGWHASPEYPIFLPSQIYTNRFVPAFTLGMTNSYNITPRFAINVDVLYLRGGSKFANNYEIRNASPEVLVYSSEATLRLHSFRTPLYLSYNISNGKVKPFIKVGITANWILGGYRLVDIQNPFIGETIEEKKDFPAEIRNLGLMQDWSFYSGIGIAVSKRLLFEVDLWLGPPREYSIIDATNEVPFNPNSLSVSNFEISYHNRAVLMGLRYIIIKQKVYS